MSEQIGTADANTQLIGDAVSAGPETQAALVDRKQHNCAGKDKGGAPVAETPVHIFKATAVDHVVVRCTRQVTEHTRPN